MANRFVEFRLAAPYYAETKVSHVKLCRSFSGYGLKEAKDFCEALSQFGYSGRMVRMNMEQFGILASAKWADPSNSFTVDDVKIIELAGVHSFCELG